jgi:hypothetical protein
MIIWYAFMPDMFSYIALSNFFFINSSSFFCNLFPYSCFLSGLISYCKSSLISKIFISLSVPSFSLIAVLLALFSSICASSTMGSMAEPMSFAWRELELTDPLVQTF